MLYKLNTSNIGKSQEFQRLFKKFGAELLLTQIPLREIDADALTVITHKASQLEEGILVEDTVLDVENESVGIHIKWLLSHLPQYVGKRACWNVFLAQCNQDLVTIYRGKVQGIIVPSQGEGGFGFDPVFLPEGCSETLAQSKPDTVNARALAVEAFFKKKPFKTRPKLTDWFGPWQLEEG